MSKRFTDTMKWDDPWFMEMDAKHKLLWLYIVDKCDNAGVWKINTAIASVYIGDPVSKDDLLFFNNGKDRIKLFDNDTKLLVKAFVKFQIVDLNSIDKSSKPSNLQKNCISSVLQYIESEQLTADDYGILSGKLPHLYRILGGKGKGKGKDNGNSKDKEDTYSAEFENFWMVYPRKEGKGKAWESWGHKNPPLQKCLDTLVWQKTSNQWTKDNGKFIPMPTTWLNQRRWEDEPSCVTKTDASSRF